MPTDLSAHSILVWFCVGFFTGFGWALGTWIVNRLLR